MPHSTKQGSLVFRGGQCNWQIATHLFPFWPASNSAYCSGANKFTKNFLVGKKIEMLVSFFGEDAKHVWVTIKTVAHWEHLQFQYRRAVSSTPKSHSSSTDGIRCWITSCKASTLAFQKVNKQWITLCIYIGQKALSTWTDWPGDHLSREKENSKKNSTRGRQDAAR